MKHVLTFVAIFLILEAGLALIGPWSWFLIVIPMLGSGVYTMYRDRHHHEYDIRQGR